MSAQPIAADLRSYTTTLSLILLVAAASTSRAHGQEETPWGDPDLRGIWDYRTITPLEKPENLENRANFTSEEATQFTDSAEERHKEAFASFLIVGDEPWADRGRQLSESDRASLVTDPDNGRLPLRTPLGERIAEKFVSQFLDVPDGPEDRPVQERCIIYPRIPLSSGNYNNNLQIIQTPGYVVLLMEMMHDARIVPLDGRERLSGIRNWLGQSRGYFDGATLVVETTDFRDYPTALGTSPDMRIIERFTRGNEDELIYEYTVIDPQAFTDEWSAMQTLRKSDDRIYEYACHEGNYGLAGILRGARVGENDSLADD